MYDENYMANKKEALISNMREQIQNLVCLEGNTLEALKDIPDDIGGNLYDWLGPGQLRVDFPFIPDTYREIRKKLGRAWAWKKSRQADDGDMYFYFVHRKTGIQLTICFDADNKLSTCRKVQVGTKTTPVYEVICEGGLL